jgi:hypothetical protein
MQRLGFSKLYARLASFQRAVHNRIAAQAKTAETSASPLLAYAATVLLLLLAILEIDLHRDELRALGLITGDADGASSLLGP